MIEKKYFFIINPIAGNGRGLAAWKKNKKDITRTKYFLYS